MYGACSLLKFYPLQRRRFFCIAFHEIGDNDFIMYLLHVVVIYAVVVVLTKVSRNSYYRRYWDVVTCFIYFITFNPFRPYKLKCPFILK